MKSIPRSPKRQLTFGDLVVAVLESTRSSFEASLAIADLLRSKRVTFATPSGQQAPFGLGLRR